MKLSKYIFYIFLILPLYVILNNIIMNSLFLISSGKIHPVIFGFYCSLKKHHYNLTQQFYLICLGYFLIKILLFTTILFKSKIKYDFETIYIIMFILDLIGVLSYIGFYYEYLQVFKIYFSFSSIFLLSGNLFNIPIILPVLLITIELIILTTRIKELNIYSVLSFLILTILSISFWWYVRIIYYYITK